MTDVDLLATHKGHCGGGARGAQVTIGGAGPFLCGNGIEEYDSVRKLLIIHTCFLDYKAS